MTSTGLDWAPDLRCTGWIDGIPTWLGGTGDEWIDCCRAHDLSDLSTNAAVTLGQCVADVGYPLIGLIMMLGLVLFGRAYQFLRKRFG